ncbi:hypothetical protein BST14_21880 [Mycobacterium arosiense ATCC BAA-1401 = DSM 45069]|uniref:2,4-diaminopentanoate dehydrogenase C-terminal domain-containing protein n=1 Tax=Mycobacterium arosiense ATCC BAA-1401 = DSM 45069 TaxID=1265311 RepID=A0A1W9Z9T6_MYCAI|nr:hypothetical protein BST14_21880 [Mycobacterium arosiense ATCC BAA-1401 = DSM 45069]
MLTGLSNEVDYVRLVETADASKHPSVEMLTEALGLGRKPAEVHGDTPYGEYWATFFSEVVTAVANGMGVTLDRIDTGLDIVTAPEDFDVAVGRIPADTVVGNCHRTTGIVDGKSLIRVEIYWSAHPGTGGWPVPAGLYRWEIEIAGRPSLRTRLDVVPSLEEGAGADYDPGVSGTAGTVINAIPAVVAADAGIVRTSMIR